MLSGGLQCPPIQNWGEYWEPLDSTGGQQEGNGDSKEHWGHWECPWGLWIGLGSPGKLSSRSQQKEGAWQSLASTGGVTESVLESSGRHWGTAGGHWGVLGSTDKLQTAPGVHQEAAESPGVAPGGCLGGSGLRKAGLRGEGGFGRRAKGRSRTACGDRGGILALPAASRRAALGGQRGSGAVAVPPVSSPQPQPTAGTRGAVTGTKTGWGCWKEAAARRVSLFSLKGKAQQRGCRHGPWLPSPALVPGAAVRERGEVWAAGQHRDAFAFSQEAAPLV